MVVFTSNLFKMVIQHLVSKYLQYISAQPTHNPLGQGEGVFGACEGRGLIKEYTIYLGTEGT